MDYWEKNAFTTVHIALDLVSCNFPVTVQFFSILHSRPCDYLYKSYQLYGTIHYCVIVCDVDNKNVMLAPQINILY